MGYARSGNRLHSVQPCAAPLASHGDSSMAFFPLPTRSGVRGSQSEVNEVLKFLTVTVLSDKRRDGQDGGSSSSRRRAARGIGGASDSARRLNEGLGSSDTGTRPAHSCPHGKSELWVPTAVTTKNFYQFFRVLRAKSWCLQRPAGRGHVAG